MNYLGALLNDRNIRGAASAQPGLQELLQGEVGARKPGGSGHAEDDAGGQAGDRKGRRASQTKEGGRWQFFGAFFPCVVIALYVFLRSRRCHHFKVYRDPPYRPLHHPDSSASHCHTSGSHGRKANSGSAVLPTNVDGFVVSATGMRSSIPPLAQTKKTPQLA